MRVNVYTQELTPEVQLVTKTADTGRTYLGLRFVMESSPKLHNVADDDDRSAITFWVPGNRDNLHIDVLVGMFFKAIGLLENAVERPLFGKKGSSKTALLSDAD